MVTASPRCGLAAVGLVTALGADPTENWARAGAPPPLTTRTDLVPSRAVQVAAVTAPLPELPPALRRYACRNNALALAAIRQIEPEVRVAIADFGAGRVGVVTGTSTSGVGDAEDAMRAYLANGRLPPEFHYAQLEPGGLSVFLAEYLGAAGPAYTISTACSSGAKALASARALLAAGVCDAVVAGGADSICRTTTNGFGALQLLSPERSVPFSANRRGLTLGEGAAFFLVTRSAAAVELLGVGESSEAYDMSAPDPAGTGAEITMRAALIDAGVPSDRVSHVTLHGTGTRRNDSMESKAVFRLFGDKPWCSALKPLVGHALGASAPIELGLVWLALRAGRNGSYPLIPHLWDETPDPELPALRFVRAGERLVATSPPVMLLNSFGFGGSNCSLVIGGTGWC